MKKKAGRNILKEISRRFSRERRGRPGRLTPVPASLRKATLAALRYGHSADEIADAAGISRQSVVNWERQAAKAAPVNRPVELKLVDERPASETVPVSVPREAVAMARIRLQSGAAVEFPVTSLDARLLAVLNESAS